jgi:hypothetical protein
MFGAARARLRFGAKYKTAAARRKRTQCPTINPAPEKKCDFGQSNSLANAIDLH